MKPKLYGNTYLEPQWQNGDKTTNIVTGWKVKYFPKPVSLHDPCPSGLMRRGERLREPKLDCNNVAKPYPQPGRWPLPQVNDHHQITGYEMLPGSPPPEFVDPCPEMNIMIILL